MSYERDGLEAGVLGRKDCLRDDCNNPKRPKLSGDDPDECAGDSGGKDKTGTDLLVGAASQPILITAQIYVIKGLSRTEFCRYYNESRLFFFIPFFTSLFHLTLISVERFEAMKYALRYETIVTDFRLKIAIVGSWVIACCPAILQSLSEQFEIIVGVVRIF